MNPLRTEIGWRFWAVWILASTLGSATGWVGGRLADFILGWLIHAVTGGMVGSEVGSLKRVIDLVVVALAHGVVFGAIFGATQWLALRRYLASPVWWTLASILGGVIALVTSALGEAGGELTRVEGAWAIGRLVGLTMGAIAAGVIVGIIQWLVLRKVVPHAGWWVLISPVGWGVSVLGATAEIPGEVVAGLIGVLATGCLGVVVCGAISGAMTGAILLWLLRQSSQSQMEA